MGSNSSQEIRIVLDSLWESSQDNKSRGKTGSSQFFTSALKKVSGQLHTVSTAEPM